MLHTVPLERLYRAWPEALVEAVRKCGTEAGGKVTYDLDSDCYREAMKMAAGLPAAPKMRPAEEIPEGYEPEKHRYVGRCCS